jgi:hypothetical protein
MRVDEAGHDNAAGCIDHDSVARLEVRPDRKNGFALDQHVSLWEIADLRIQRHHRAAANDVAPARLAAVHRGIVRRGGAWRE